MEVVKRDALTPEWTKAAVEFFKEKRCCEHEIGNSKCQGFYSLIFYSWCNQYHVRCSHCLQEIKQEKWASLFKGAISHLEANILQRITVRVEMEKEEKERIINQRTRNIVLQQQELFQTKFNKGF
jgi:hypothetical protein